MLKKKLRGIALALTASLLLIQPLAAHAPELHGFRMVSFEPPVPAPGFELPNLEAQSLKLEDFRGRYVLLNFWATWCPPCVKELPSLQLLEDTLKADGFSVVAVTVDSPEDKGKVAQFVEDLGLSFAIPLDSASQVAGIYGAREFPSSFLIDPDGQIIAAAKGERDWASEDALSYFWELIEGQGES